MSMLLRTAASQEIVLPSTLSYQRKKDVDSQKAPWWPNFFQTPLQLLGQVLRNTFYLPWSSRKVNPDFELNQRLAEKITQTLKNSGVSCAEEHTIIRQFFSVRDVAIQLEGSVSQIFTIRLFQSKMPIGQKQLRIILFSFNGNIETTGDNRSRKWAPVSIQALSKSPLFVLKALQSAGIHIDSLVTTSLGNVVLEGLKYSGKEDSSGILPPTLIINRGLTSVKKVANQLYAWPLNYLLYSAARLSGWDANPEQELLYFLEREEKISPFPKRKIIFIEVLKDFYFSNKGRFNLDIHEKITALGHKVFRASFWPFPFQAHAHHALSLDHLVNNSVTEMRIDTVPLDLGPNEKISSAIARNIFLNPNEGVWHTCFYMCGNDATLDIGTVREVLPLLSAYIEEGQKTPQRNSTEECKEQAI